VQLDSPLIKVQQHSIPTKGVPHEKAGKKVSPERHQLQLRDQIVTVVERFVLERHIQSLHRQIEDSEPSEIAIGQRVYYRGKLLGKGGFAKCYEFVCSETKKTYAGKVVEKETLQKMRRR